MTDAYLEWSRSVDQEVGMSWLNMEDVAEDDESRMLRIVDLFGYLPCSPGNPSVVITIRAVEYYRVLFLRCPRLSVQPFVKALCDIHGVPFKPYLREQFSICFDLYLSILAEAKTRVNRALGRDGVNWRVENTCPACQYRLAGEEKLKFGMMGCMDGNDSLKRVQRKSSGMDDLGNVLVGAGPSRERMDSRTGGGTYFLSREEVDQFARPSSQNDAAMLNTEDSPCAPRWKNMSDKLTASMWAIFEETGLFLSLCRHGFVLLAADMVRSGEQSKYALAIVNRLIDILGEDLAMGYDIGCGFAVTAQDKHYHSLVGTFHGHAHARLCQTKHLGTYVEGNGLEDSEGCERFFSKSNALASSVRYSSSFHRRQAISAYFEHNDDFETWPNLVKFLENNYKQALEILRDVPVLQVEMHELGILSETTFSEWLEEEKEYLKSLKKEPLEETLQMEYYRKLEALFAAEKDLSAANHAWIMYTPASLPSKGPDPTRKLETDRRHALEARDDLKVHVRMLEHRLGITERWVPGTEQWERTKKMVSSATYQRAVDKLEGLVVARLFELTKMNMSGTGYKLRKHMGHALKSRSQAIRTALDQYNAAAASLKPPKPALTWEQIVECTFLSDFDLLRDTREDIRDRPWSRPRERKAMDRYFKILRAREEIKRLNIEIRRVATFLQDEDVFLQRHETELAADNPALSHQIQLYRRRRGRYNANLWSRLIKVTKLPGFTGTLLRGAEKSPFVPSLHNPTVEAAEDDDDGANDNEDDDNEDFVQAMRVMEVVGRSE
ncbi:hypothetical protein K435DRAFT_823707 [Dendrothele bispora CBS 962.96]|uniref:CxC1-like cysteine cluster associated with KDZ transposases domain-containing protein n=1 Tax=Dendrothele bispora (strain CBS 962.96) TaxID=1314807 RepID=A0A4S8KWB3_DENBC|nr:hypothetical protein K435DRAFT_823707 [Dendrothele bispora CBS 962.96]